jgi:hypothetical protein
MQLISHNMKNVIMNKGNIKKVTPATQSPNRTTGIQTGKPAASVPAAKGTTIDELANLKATLQAVQQIRLSAQRYLQQTEMRARSEAQQLILQARLGTQKHIKELLRQASDEIQKVLADVRMIRITAQEELAAQKKFTNAARLRSFTLALQEEEREPEKKQKKQLAGKK